MKNNIIRKLNFTDRRRIFQDSYSLGLEVGEDPSAVALLADLDNLRVSGLQNAAGPRVVNDPDLANAKLVLDVKRRMYFKRFEFGSASDIEVPEDLGLDLGPVDQVRARARLRIVSRNNDGGKPARVLAEADWTPLVGRGSLLPIVSESFEGPSAKLIYRLDFPEEADSDESVVLVLNRELGESRVISASVPFRGLLLPEIVITILREILFVYSPDESSIDANSWIGKWLRFGAECARGEELNPSAASADEAVQWLERVKVGLLNRKEYHSVTRKISDIWSNMGVNDEG